MNEDDLFSIFQFLTRNTLLLVCARVNKAWNKIVKECQNKKIGLAWQLTLETIAFHSIDGIAHHLNNRDFFSLSRVSKRMRDFFVYAVKNDMGWFGRNWIPAKVFQKLKKSRPTRRCGKPGCLSLTQQFGVCGRHKIYSFRCTDKLYQQMVQNMTQVYYALKEEDNNLGDDIMNVQVAFGNNVAGPQIQPFQPRLRRAGSLILQIRYDIAYYQQHIYPDLVSNTSTRLSHRILGDGRACTCSYCVVN